MVSITSITGLEIRIIQFYLEHHLQSFAIREIAREMKIDYKQIHTAIQKLVKSNIIHKKRQANLDLCSLNLKDNHSAICYSEMLRRDKWIKRHPEFIIFFQDILKKINCINYIMLIFGSFAKNKETNHSDLDLMIIAPSKQISEEIELIINNHAVFLKRKVHILILDEKEFLANLSDKNINVVKEALNNHIILTGVEAFYNGVRKVI